MKFEFEEIDDHHSRAKVLGGWLVKVYEDVVHFVPDYQEKREGYDSRISMCFVPDPNHEWSIENE